MDSLARLMAYAVVHKLEIFQTDTFAFALRKNGSAEAYYVKEQDVSLYR